MTNFPLMLTNEETVSLRKLAKKLYRINERINIARFEGKVPKAADTIRALELADVLMSYMKLDDMDVYFETVSGE